MLVRGWSLYSGICAGLDYTNIHQDIAALVIVLKDID